MSTATTSKTSQRAVKVVVKPATGKPTIYRFENQGCNSRAAKWMQKHHPLAVAIDETTAELADGSVLKVERGCTVAELYPITDATPTAEQPAQSEPQAEAEPAPSAEEMVEQPAEEPTKPTKKPRGKPAKKGRAKK